MTRPREVVQAMFHDSEELAELVRAWDLDFRQLTPGSFSGELWQVTEGQAQVSRCHLGAHVHQRGSAPAGVRTFAVLAADDLRIRWRGQEVTGEDLMCFPQDGELESVSPPGFDVFTLSFPEEQLQSVARDLDMPEALRMGSGGSVLSLHPEALRRLRQRLLELYQAQVAGEDPLDVRLRDVFSDDVPQALVAALATRDTARTESMPATRTRDLAMQHALVYIEAHAVEALTVTELCRETGVSERTLQYAFLERFGVRPKAFLRARRLQGARSELRRASKRQLTVTGVANRWGFWHLGQFALDYGRLFGERPSYTLSRPGID